jgi:hypothetical protein
MQRYSTTFMERRETMIAAASSSVTHWMPCMVFINPTPLTLTLEYALFGHDGTFFGCDRDTLSPNGRTRYTMEASNRVVNSPPGSARIRLTEGTLKSILFVPAASPAYGTDGALQAGLEIHVGGGQRTPISADAARAVLEASCSGLRGRHLLSTCFGGFTESACGDR